MRRDGGERRIAAPIGGCSESACSFGIAPDWHGGRTNEGMTQTTLGVERRSVRARSGFQMFGALFFGPGIGERQARSPAKHWRSSNLRFQHFSGSFRSLQPLTGVNLFDSVRFCSDLFGSVPFAFDLERLGTPVCEGGFAARIVAMVIDRVPRGRYEQMV